MSSRIEVELTSERPDGTWTWRAAGARQPKGVLDGALLPEKAKVGDVVRAEADFDIDGITVTAVLPPRSGRREPQRLEILGPPPEERHPGGRPDDARHPKARGPERPRSARPADRERRTPRRDGERRRRPDQRPARGDSAARAASPPAPARPKPKKLRPGRAHRDAVLAELPPEQHPIAVQVLRGGIPAVRAAIEEQNVKARKEGLPEAPRNAVLAIAERLLPRLRVAEWLDRAEAALADPEDLALRDLRSVVVSADDVAREPSTREAAARLREILERRTATERQEWLDDVSRSLESGRVVRALRLSSRPPQPGDHLPPEVTTRLTDAAGAAMTADAGPERWATVLDAVAYSAVRRTVTPAGVPPEPGEELVALVRKHAGRVPGIAPLFGVEAPAERTDRERRRGTTDQPPEHHAHRRPAPPPDGALAPPRPRRIPPPPSGSGAPVTGTPVAEPAPPRTSPADPPAGAAVPPAGAAPAAEPAPGIEAEAPTEPAPAVEAAAEPSPAAEPVEAAAEPSPAAEPEAVPAAEPPTEPEAAAEPSPAAEPEAVPAAEPPTEPEAAAEPSPAAELEAVPAAEPFQSAEAPSEPATDAGAFEPSPARGDAPTTPVAPEVPVAGAPAAQPAPSQLPPAGDAVVDPVGEGGHPDRDEPGPSPST